MAYGQNQPARNPKLDCGGRFLIHCFAYGQSPPTRDPIFILKAGLWYHTWLTANIGQPETHKLFFGAGFCSALGPGASDKGHRRDAESKSSAGPIVRQCTIQRTTTRKVETATDGDGCRMPNISDGFASKASKQLVGFRWSGPATSATYSTFASHPLRTSSESCSHEDGARCGRPLVTPPAK